MVTGNMIAVHGNGGNVTAVHGNRGNVTAVHGNGKYDICTW